MEHAAAFAALYRFEALTEPMRQHGPHHRRRRSAELRRAVGNLRKFTDPESIREQTVAVHTLENEADMVYREAIAALFADGARRRGNWSGRRTCCSRLEDGVDQCEDAMDVIRSVVVKNG